MRRRTGRIWGHQQGGGLRNPSIHPSIHQSWWQVAASRSDEMNESPANVYRIHGPFVACQDQLLCLKQQLPITGARACCSSLLSNNLRNFPYMRTDDADRFSIARPRAFLLFPSEIKQKKNSSSGPTTTDRQTDRQREKTQKEIVSSMFLFHYSSPCVTSVRLHLMYSAAGVRPPSRIGISRPSLDEFIIILAPFYRNWNDRIGIMTRFKWKGKKKHN